MRRSVTAAIVAGAVVGVVVAPVPAHAAAIVSVTAGSVLNVRSGPSIGYDVVRTISPGNGLPISCQVSGETITGTERTTALWDRLADGRFVSDAYVQWQGSPPGACGANATAQVSGYLNQRPNASTLLAPSGRVDPSGGLDVVCQLGGETITGSAGASAMWDLLPSGQFVADAYVGWASGRPDVPWCSLTEGTFPGPGEDFIAWAAPMAQRTYLDYKVPASVTLAQAILESGWGRSALTVDGNSFFGMKCFGTPGRVAVGCRPYQTYECDAGCYSTSASFRVYLSSSASFVDHAVQLSTLPRYAGAFAYSQDPDRFAVEIHRAGYATSPTYAENLIGLMRQYNLYRFDAIL